MRSNETMNLVWLSLGTLAAFALMTEPAMAQQIQAATQYGAQNIGRPIINMGVLAVGAGAMLLRVSLPVVGLAGAGALGVANYQQIGATLGGV